MPARDCLAERECELRALAARGERGKQGSQGSEGEREVRGASTGLIHTHSAGAAAAAVHATVHRALRNMRDDRLTCSLIALACFAPLSLSLSLCSHSALSPGPVCD